MKTGQPGHNRTADSKPEKAPGHRSIFGNMAPVSESGDFLQSEKYAYRKQEIKSLLHRIFPKSRATNNCNRSGNLSGHRPGARRRWPGKSFQLPATRGLVRLVAGIIYLVWVLDLLPDFIPGLGMTDDLAIAVWVYDGFNNREESRE